MARCGVESVLLALTGGGCGQDSTKITLNFGKSGVSHRAQGMVRSLV